MLIETTRLIVRPFREKCHGRMLPGRFRILIAFEQSISQLCLRDFPFRIFSPQFLIIKILQV